MYIRTFHPDDESAVITLWQVCGLIRPWNDPKRDIARKIAEQPELFLVVVEADRIVACAMFGYDGHRGSVSYLAVAPERQRTCLGRQLMSKGEELLLRRGCPKINLLVRTSNLEVIEFYRKLGYIEDAVVNLGKRLQDDLANPR